MVIKSGKRRKIADLYGGLFCSARTPFFGLPPENGVFSFLRNIETETLWKAFLRRAILKTIRARRRFAGTAHGGAGFREEAWLYGKQNGKKEAWEDH
jgi:hypothetical protein